MGNSKSRNSKKTAVALDKELGKPPKPENKTRIIVIGSSTVGKSTVFKSILLSYINDYFKGTPRDVYHGDYIDLLRENTVESMKQLIELANMTEYALPPLPNQFGVFLNP